MNAKNTERRHDLDWLRVLAILSVFVFHSTRFFDPWFWHVKNPVTYELAGLFQAFMTTWMMPFIFLISGASIFHAMNKGGAGTFFKDKALRLFVPLLVAIFTYAPLQVYLERITHHQFRGSFLAWLPHYFEGVYLGDGSAGNFAIIPMHMWYVFFLLLYCLILYPLFRWWKGNGRRALEIIGHLIASPWSTWLVLSLPIVTVHLFVSDTALEAGSGGWPYLYYPIFLIYGFIIASNERLQTNLKRMRWFNLALGTIFITTLMILIATPSLAALNDELGDLFWILSANTLLPAFLGLGMQYLTFTNPFHKYVSEAVMGFYILHQTVLLVVGYFLVGWSLPDAAKWALITGSSFTIIMVIYEFLIRRRKGMRWLCGMKPLNKIAATHSAKSTITEPA